MHQVYSLSKQKSSRKKCGEDGGAVDDSWGGGQEKDAGHSVLERRCFGWR